MFLLVEEQDSTWDRLNNVDHSLRNYDLHDSLMSNKQLYHILFYFYKNQYFKTSFQQILKPLYLLQKLLFLLLSHQPFPKHRCFIYRNCCQSNNIVSRDRKKLIGYLQTTVHTKINTRLSGFTAFCILAIFIAGQSTQIFSL